METNIPGLFACGDITGTPYQYIKAAGQGNVAALSAWLIWMRKNAKPGSVKRRPHEQKCVGLKPERILQQIYHKKQCVMRKELRRKGKYYGKENYK